MLRLAASVALLGLGGCVLNSTFDKVGTGGGGSGQGGTTTSLNTGGGTTNTTSSGFGGQGGEGGAAPAKCGDGILGGNEQCDDGNNLAGDGCEACKYAAFPSCPSGPATPIIVSADAPITLTGDTTDQGNDLPYSNADIPHFDCDSKGDDVAFVVQTKGESGTLEIKFHTDLGNDKGRLHLRTDCPTALDSKEKIQASLQGELACYKSGTGDVVTKMWMKAGERRFIVISGNGPPDKAHFTLKLTFTRCGDLAKNGLEDCDDTSSTCEGCLDTLNCGASLSGATTRLFDADHCFVVVPEAGNFYEARRKCVAAGGDLVSAETMEKRMKLSMPEETWLGLADFDHDEAWSWLNGVAATSDVGWPAGLWASGEPGSASNEPDCAYGELMLGASNRKCGDDTNSFVCDLSFVNP